MSNSILHKENIAQNILIRAQNLFFAKGQLTATMSEVAEYAEVKRTLVNYYYKDRQILFNTAFESLINDFKIVLHDIFAANIIFESKLDQLIAAFIKFRSQYPYLEYYQIQKAQCAQLHAKCNVSHLLSAESLPQFLQEVEEEMRNGRIVSSDPLHFLINLNALVTYPIIMRPFFQSLYQMDGDRYQELLSERKIIIKKLLYK